MAMREGAATGHGRCLSAVHQVVFAKQFALLRERSDPAPHGSNPINARLARANAPTHRASGALGARRGYRASWCRAHKCSKAHVYDDDTCVLVCRP